MTFLPGFEDDVFISYARLDNESLTQDQKGWIENLHYALEKRVEQYLGANAEVFLDRGRMRGNDLLEETIIDKHIRGTAVLVSVVTPRYIQSDWCLKELRKFFELAQGGVSIDNKSRLLKVVKTHVPLEKLPPELQGLEGYEFFEMEKTTHRPRELNPEVGAVSLSSYWKKLDDLAYDIHDLLKRLKGLGEGRAAQTNARSGVTVYLAETTNDLRDERDEIRRELVERGYTVLPDAPLPRTGADLREAVRDYLSRASLSVHLIGEIYGYIAEDENRSHVYLQNELASERSSEPGFSRVIWMPVDLKAREARQQEFVDYLHNDAGAQQGAEVLQNSLEELKTIIGDKLTAKQQPAAVTTANGPLRVYLICDRQDVESISPLEDYLFNQGYEVCLPAFEGDEAQVREDHKENLLVCDACIIYYGKATDFWLRAKLRDLSKIAGYGRATPIPVKAIYVCGPETDQKQRFRTHEADPVIKNFAEFSPDALQPLLAPIESLKGARR